MSFKIKLIYKGSIAKIIDQKINECLIFNILKEKILILLNEKVTTFTIVWIMNPNDCMLVQIIYQIINNQNCNF